MAKVSLQLFPYATQSGTIEIPDGMKKESEIYDYIFEHFNEIVLDKVELDYCGTDIEIDDVDGELPDYDDDDEDEDDEDVED